MKAPFLKIIFLLSLGVVLAFPVSAQKEEEPSRYDPAQGVRKLGVTHNIAADRKIENVGGLYEPEGIDKYMKRLIDNLEAKITALEAQSRRTEEKLDQLIQNQSRGSVSSQQGTVLQSQPQPSPSPRNIFR